MAGEVFSNLEGMGYNERKNRRLTCEIGKRKPKEPKSLNKRLLVFMILCWAVPIAVFFTFTTVSYRDGIISKAERLMEDELSNVAAFASIRIEEAISLCQKPSYEKTWENVWKKYRKGEMARNEFLQNVNGSLKGKFYLDERFDLYAFYLYGEVNPGCYSSRIGTSYHDYINEIQADVKEIMAWDSSYAYVKVFDGRIFIIRNLYTTDNYERYGTLVVELNRQKVFQDVPEDMQDTLIVCIDERESVLDFHGGNEDEKLEELVGQMLAAYDGAGSRSIIKAGRGGYKAYLLKEKYDNYSIGVILWAKRSEIYSSLYDLYGIVFWMLVMFIPVIAYGIYFLRKEIRVPISRLMKACKSMEEGQIGMEVPGKPMTNAEFNYLMNSFNSMSSQVKYLFDYAYDEKLARKDAQIQALQAQINPHFLNNTLEMMNWQARMSGDIVVSKMIEALGTVLNYRMNRANIREIHLAEELQCTDAYFYIMSMRFGRRLQIEKDIDEDLLYLSVPPLILQPIVENAIVHGVETVKNGVIGLKIYHDDDNVYLQVSNSGKAVGAAELERIRTLLTEDGEQMYKERGGHISIGIRNVNQRIKLVYGDDYGLTIEQAEGPVIVWTITIPYRERENKKPVEEFSRMERELKELKRDNG